MDPAVGNVIVGHSWVRSVQDRYIRVSDQVLLNAVDSMTFDHGCTELDFVEEAPRWSPEKSMESTGKFREKKKAVVASTTLNSMISTS